MNCVSLYTKTILKNMFVIKAKINSGKFQPRKVRFILFQEDISCSDEEIFSENKRKHTIPYRTG